MRIISPSNLFYHSCFFFLSFIKAVESFAGRREECGDHPDAFPRRCQPRIPKLFCFRESIPLAANKTSSPINFFLNIENSEPGSDPAVRFPSCRCFAVGSPAPVATAALLTAVVKSRSCTSRRTSGAVHFARRSACTLDVALLLFFLFFFFVLGFSRFIRGLLRELVFLYRRHFPLILHSP